MARDPRAASALLAVTVTLLLALSACGGSPKSPSHTSQTGCINPSAAHRLEVVVEPAGGPAIARCVGFKGQTLSGLDALKASRIEYATETTSFGVAVCQLDSIPAHYSTCFPPGGSYWAMFYAARGSGWTVPKVGIQGITLHPGDSLGWRYDPQSQNPANPPARAPGGSGRA